MKANSEHRSQVSSDHLRLHYGSNQTVRARIHTKKAPVTAKSHLGVGLYTYPGAARIIGVKPAKLRRWVVEYRYRANGHYRHSEPVINRYFDDEPVLTFLEVVELLFVRLFRDQGVSMPTIRRAAERAAERYDADYPFAVERFDTDGKHIFATLRTEADSERDIEDVSRATDVCTCM